MSESYMSPRPVFSTGLADGACALATPPYAHAYLTTIIHANAYNLKTLPVRKTQFQPFWRGPELQAYRFQKNIGGGFPVTMPRATLWGGVVDYPLLSIDDPALAQFLFERGAQTVPVAVRIVDSGPVSFAAGVLNTQAPVKTLDTLYRERTEQGAAGTDYTTFMPFDELATYINGNIHIMHGTLRARWSGNEQSEYKEFLNAASLLDRLAYAGAPGAWVKNPRDVFSVTEGMRDIHAQPQLPAPWELPTMEWIDRFTRLYERRENYRDQGLSSDAVDAMAQPIAWAIGQSYDGMVLAGSQLSTMAQTYLGKFVTAAPQSERSSQYAPVL